MKMIRFEFARGLLVGMAGFLLIPMQAAQAQGRLNEGSLVAWGNNDLGQTNAPTGNTYTQLAAGDHFGIALRSDRSVAAWGSDSSGQVSYAPTDSVYLQVAAGYQHGLVLAGNGTIGGWGLNSDGQAVPPAGYDFKQIAAGSDFSLALRNNGTIVGWGYNGSGQTNTPGGNNFSQVACSSAGNHALALRTDGAIEGWGYNNFGQATAPTGSNYTQVAAGREHSVALRSDGSIYAWGSNEWGGQASNAPTGNTFLQVAANLYHSLALRSDGSIAAWGGNYDTNTLPAGVFLAVAAGRSFDVALRARENYDDLLVTGGGTSATLQRSINVGGNATILGTTLTVQSNQTMTVGGVLNLSNSPSVRVLAGSALTLNSALAGNTGWIKYGPGRMNLTGNSSGYTNITEIWEGSLAVNGNLGGPVSVLGGGTLGGTGTLGQVTINFGAYSPGNSPGTQTVSGLTFTGGTFKVEIMDLGTHDLVISSNGIHVSENGSQTFLNLALTNASLSLNDRILILDNLSSQAANDMGHFWYHGLVDDIELFNGTVFSVLDAGSGTTNLFQIAYDFNSPAGGGTANDITLTAVPEPGTGAILLLGCAAAALRYRWRRHIHRTRTQR
jgi:hypothetical protein